ncbi:response regulator transcription factor [Paenibacillus silviterrae]|uniref:response regulator transcription factor n=1 Tax=Paenibacillus silviterrae TaxID=3242194 RepID=UPI002542705F|nr:response regulator [Paenibacillus chinjuensis]
MYQLLIVDDEPSVVDTIAHTLPWQELGVAEVMCAYSGREALELIKKHVVDIVITDIRMPGMDGIQLMEQSAKFTRSTQFILLTGYAEFDYAKRALQLGAADYLLKPVSDSQLIESIRRIIQQLEADVAEAASFQLAVEILREHQPALKSEVLSKLVEEGRLEAEDHLALLGISFLPEDSISLVLIRLEGRFSRYNQRDRMLMEFSVFNMAEELMGPYFELWTCRDRHEYLVLALKGKEDTEWEEGLQLLPRMCSQLQHHVMRYLKGDISVVIGNPVNYPDAVQAGYQSAVKTMRRRIGKDVGLLMTVNDPDSGQRVAALKTLHEAPTLSHLFEAGMWEEAVRKIENIAAELEENWDDSPELLAEWYHTLVSACYRYAHANGETLSRLLERIGVTESIPELGTLLSVDRMMEWAVGLCRKLSIENSEELHSSRAMVIEQVKAYIHEHLSEDVSLHILADQVNLHPVYLSKVFKLETGEGIKEYLHRVRMEKAVHLLKRSDSKIYEVTTAVGYLNTPYFIKVFKKEFGMTPQEYRDHHSIRQQ